MTVEEVKKAVEEMKAAGHDEEEILASLYIMFQNDKLDIDTLEAIVHVMGYELTDEFKNMSPEDQKTKGYEEEESEEAEEASEEEKFPEEKPEGKPEDKEEEEVEEDKEEVKEEPDGELSEEDEKKKAFELFGLDK